MHRTDSIDFAIVISGEGDLAYAGEDGQLRKSTSSKAISSCRTAPFTSGATAPARTSWVTSSRSGLNAKRHK